MRTNKFGQNVYGKSRSKLKKDSNEEIRYIYIFVVEDLRDEDEIELLEGDLNPVSGERCASVGKEEIGKLIELLSGNDRYRLEKEIELKMRTFEFSLYAASKARSIDVIQSPVDYDAMLVKLLYIVWHCWFS